MSPASPSLPSAGLAASPGLASLPGLAEPRLDVLANGARVMQLPLADSPVVCIDFWCRAGSVFEHSGESGLAHFLEHMVFKGSARLEAGEFDGRIEALGGASNAATGFDDVHYYVLIPPREAPEAVELLLELVLETRLPAEAFELERQVVLEELAQSEDQPEDMALQHLLGLACGSHPYGQPILGQRQALRAHSPSRMAAFQERLYTADGCVLALSGALSEAGPALRERIDATALARLRPGGSRDALPPLRVRPGRHRLALPRLESARLLMVWCLPPASELTAVMGADLLTSLLAEGRRSRLVARLREELRLVESIDLDLHVMECGSFALLEAITDADALAAVSLEIERVWRELSAAPVGADEWERACRLVANGYRFGLESAAGVTATLAGNLLWDRCEPLGRPLQELRNWTPETLQQQLLPLLNPERACVLEAVPA